MRILFTNDDGIHAAGLRTLVTAFARAGHTAYVCAPDRERSGASHSSTLASPLRVWPAEVPGATLAWAAEGTPSDCASLGLFLCREAGVDLVVSGINRGMNQGGACIYSGTVGAAMEGAMQGVQALAVSLCVGPIRGEDRSDYAPAARVALRVADWMQDHPWRCSAINPSGRNVLMHYAVPLKFTDVMLFAKGGFLFGNYGTEEVLAPWMQNFRVLPAVPFKDVESPSPDVTVREGFADGVHYIYAVNTSPGERRVTLGCLEGFHEMVSGQAATRDVVLAPYELRSYCK